ncbi:MAG TPA: hypothetical protein VFQ85_15530 [Mycobacteriales bacterium]|jgi:hypothetical protein|nr:hypothetical protein [Mycobacteriales bacterium]
MRIVLGVGLAVALTGGAAYAVVPGLVGRADRAAVARAAAFATALPDPPGAAKANPHDCHGDGTLRCVVVRGRVDAVTATVAGLVRSRGRAPSTDCGGTPASCTVRVPSGRGHATFVFVRPMRGGRSLVTVAAS